MGLRNVILCKDLVLSKELPICCIPCKWINNRRLVLMIFYIIFLLVLKYCKVYNLVIITWGGKHKYFIFWVVETEVFRWCHPIIWCLPWAQNLHVLIFQHQTILMAAVRSHDESVQFCLQDQVSPTHFWYVFLRNRYAVGVFFQPFDWV